MHFCGAAPTSPWKGKMQRIWCAKEAVRKQLTGDLRHFCIFQGNFTTLVQISQSICATEDAKPLQDFHIMKPDGLNGVIQMSFKSFFFLQCFEMLAKDAKLNVAAVWQCEILRW